MPLQATDKYTTPQFVRMLIFIRCDFILIDRMLDLHPKTKGSSIAQTAYLTAAR